MKLKISLLFALIAVGLHVYLAFHFYGFNYGISSGDSLCNLSSQFNCDTVTASRYSSVMGVPVALFGMTANLVLSVMLIMWMLGWTENIVRHSKLTLLLSTLVAATSIVMGSISTFLIGSYCLFCIATYFLSFGIFGLVSKSQIDSSVSMFSFMPDMFKGAKNYLFLFLAIPVGAFFVHKAYTKEIRADKLGPLVKSIVANWQAAPTVELSAKALMTMGPEDAKMVIKEFADFRCGHCKQASPNIKAFFKSRSDVRVEFYAFPLDGTCNEAITGGDGVSCLLAKSVYCAETLAQKGWAMHDHIFSAQEEINMSPTLDFARETISAALKDNDIDEDKYKECVENSETDAVIRLHAKLGKDSGVEGTPTFYVNARKLARANLIPVLEAAHNSLQK